ncbi:hypothetical protein AVEN_249253-1 [Araneus ventricosus]|uniref:Uncharacterized protein n=1 Tax=Araneus ventricosus TaxID=182803 RepID=A0A4Y2U238_ARAVE|nr:hypothetical protein AVEN_249253-1 [Araneus ventricosus]
MRDSDIIFKKEQAENTLLIKQAEIDFFKEFLDSLVQRTSQGVVKQIIKDKRIETRISQIKTEDCTYTQNYVESTDYVLEKKPFLCLDEEDDITQRFFTDEVTVDFSSDEIEACMATMKKKGAPGWDE